MMGSSCCKFANMKRRLFASSDDVVNDRQHSDIYNLGHEDLDDVSSEPCYEGDFLQLCSKGSVPLVKEVIENYNFDINAQVSGHTPLQEAITSGKLDIVKYLVSAGAKVNTDNQHNYAQSPLHIAALCKQPDTSEFLISKGANVNDKDHLGATPLFWAVCKGCNRTALALINGGAEVNSNPKIPFHAATAKNDVDMMYLLFTKGADPEARGVTGWTPLHLCAEDGHYAAARFLVVGICVSLDSLNDRMETAFQRAMMQRHIRILDLLMMAGYDAKKEECVYNRPNHWILGVDDEMRLTRRYAWFAKNPICLQDLCIFRIRRLLGRRLPSVLDDIPYPAKLTNLLKLSHIPDA